MNKQNTRERKIQRLYFKNKLVLLDEQKKKILAYLSEKKPVLIHGETGLGKTSMAFEIAKEKGWKLIRINASDSRTKDTLEKYYRMIRTRSKKIKFGKKKTGILLFLFDEVDGFYDCGYLHTMLVNAQHPVILTANNDWKIPKWVFKHPKTRRSFVRTIKFYPPKAEDIVKILRAKGIDGNFAGITRDVRAAEKVLLYGSSSDPIRNQFDQTKYMITSPSSIVKEVEKARSWKFFSNWTTWFLENLPIFHRVYMLFESLELMSIADIYQKPEVLQFLPEVPVGGAGQKTKYPEYLHVLKKYKRNSRKK